MHGGNLYFSSNQKTGYSRRIVCLFILHDWLEVKGAAVRQFELLKSDGKLGICHLVTDWDNVPNEYELKRWRVGEVEGGKTYRDKWRFEETKRFYSVHNFAHNV